MSSKFAKQYAIPSEFPEILKEFTREVLRAQPADVYEFGAKYFERKAQGLPDEVGARGGPMGQDELDLSLEEVEAIIQDLFGKYDEDGNGFLDPKEFKNLMEDLQARMDFPPDEVFRFLAEADQNADGNIEYEEFIPLALQIIQGMYAKKRFEQHMEDVEAHAENLLVHGMSREELTDVVGNIFERMDSDESGSLSKAEFVTALTSMELGLTRREVNTIMFQIDQDQDGNISYREFVPFAFDLLHKLTSLRLLETEMEHDELATFLLDLFKSKDVNMEGMLYVEDVRDLLHQAMLGLSRMQIYTVISEAELHEGMIAYTAFIPRAVGLIRSMLSFERSMMKASAGQEQYFALMGQLFASGAPMAVNDFCTKISGVINDKERAAVANMLQGQSEGSRDFAEKSVWTLIRNIRHHGGQ
jgi:Ca2+-binding EF-hand superfamily protein